MTDTAVDADPTPSVAAAAFRTPWGHIAVILLASVGLVLNIIGGNESIAGPVEEIMYFGISVDLGVAILVCSIGLVVSLLSPRAQRSIAFPKLGLAFSLVAFVAWLVNADGLFATLFFDGRGRYMHDTVGPFFFGIPWVLGAIFSAYGLRGRGGSAKSNAAASVGLLLWAVVLAGVIASGLLYGADLTD